MEKHISGILINAFVFVLIIITLIVGIVHNNELEVCKTEQSTFCPVITCPADPSNAGPCKGFAYREIEEGKYRCSNAPLQTVDINGKPI